MERLKLLIGVAFIGALLCTGCAHEQVSKVGLISFGNLEGKVIPNHADGPILQGSSAAHVFRHSYYLSDAVRDALKNSEYDTLVDAEVITRTNLMVPSNKIIVRGTALNSKNLPSGGR